MGCVEERVDARGTEEGGETEEGDVVRWHIGGEEKFRLSDQEFQEDELNPDFKVVRR
jgi:hypothetical protein